MRSSNNIPTLFAPERLLQCLLSYCTLDICKVFEVIDLDLFGDLLHNLINVLYFLPQTHIGIRCQVPKK